MAHLTGCLKGPIFDISGANYSRRNDPWRTKEVINLTINAGHAGTAYLSFDGTIRILVIPDAVFMCVAEKGVTHSAYPLNEDRIKTLNKNMDELEQYGYILTGDPARNPSHSCRTTIHPMLWFPNFKDLEAFDKEKLAAPLRWNLNVKTHCCGVDSINFTGESAEELYNKLCTNKIIERKEAILMFGWDRQRDKTGKAFRIITGASKTTLEKTEELLLERGGGSLVYQKAAHRNKWYGLFRQDIQQTVDYMVETGQWQKIMNSTEGWTF